MKELWQGPSSEFLIALAAEERAQSMFSMRGIFEKEMGKNEADKIKERKSLKTALLAVPCLGSLNKVYEILWRLWMLTQMIRATSNFRDAREAAFSHVRCRLEGCDLSSEGE